MNQRDIQAHKNAIIAKTPAGVEDIEIFASEREAWERVRIVNEAMSWIGTPFRDCTDIKGPNGGVDCAMLLVRSYVDSGKLQPFDPRPYPPQWHMHHSEQRFLEWIEVKLAGVRVEKPRIGDCLVYQFGRCFSHGAIYIGNGEIVHSYYESQLCHLTRMTDSRLAFLNDGRTPRPLLFFEVGR